MKTVVLGISAGIAAYKSLDLVKLLKKEGFNVLVILTQGALNIVSEKALEKASGNKVFINLFEKGFDYKKVLREKRVEHIDLADKADLLVISPATANIIAKLAQGFADDYLTTVALAVRCPIIICPSMNVNMWNNPLVQQNLLGLKELGYQIMEPDEGDLACGYNGKGRLPNVRLIKDEIKDRFEFSSSLKNKKILITTGGTIEEIDDVRFITNKSSGKMGIALAEECFKLGAEVLLLRAKTSVQPRYLIKEKTFTTSGELFKLIKKNINQFDVLFHAAAVSDFKVKKSSGKLGSRKSQRLTLMPQVKILDQIKKLQPNITLISFKAEYSLKKDSLIQSAKKRLNETKSDLIIANDVSKRGLGFESDFNEVYVIPRSGQVLHLPKALKKDLAKDIVEFALLQNPLPQHY